MDTRKSVPMVILERYVLGELPQEELKRIDLLLAGDEALHEKVESIRRSNEQILLHYSPDEAARDVALKVHTDKTAYRVQQIAGTRMPWYLFAKPVMAAGAVLLVVIAITPFLILHINRQSGYERTRAKGLSPYLTVYRRHGEHSERLGNLDSATVGDVIQVGYVAAEKKYGVILSCDGRGVVTLHYPASDTGSTRLDNNGEVLLPTAYELDDAPLFEHFFFITSDFSIAPTNVRMAIEKFLHEQKTGKPDVLLDIPASWGQYSFVLRKGSL